MNPANNMIGITHHVSIAPPVINRSTKFIAASMEIMDIRDMPIATLNASFNIICLANIKVSRAIDVSNPLIIAKAIILMADKPESVKMNWKAAKDTK